MKEKRNDKNKVDEVVLNNDLFIGEGMGRKCYIHPENKNLCIKIITRDSE